MWARSVLLLGISLDIHLHGGSVSTAEFKRQEALASYILVVIKLFTFHQDMELDEWENINWQKCTSQS
jgi:hypothetical protein